jgi:hypothetical protein
VPFDDYLLANEIFRDDRRFHFVKIFTQDSNAITQGCAPIVNLDNEIDEKACGAENPVRPL